jgi:hypothetical protein
MSAATIPPAIAEGPRIHAAVVASAVVTWIIAAAMVAIRFYTRSRISRTLGLEDWLVAGALVSFHTLLRCSSSTLMRRNTNIRLLPSFSRWDTALPRSLVSRSPPPFVQRWAGHSQQEPTSQQLWVGQPCLGAVAWGLCQPLQGNVIPPR